MTTAQDIDAKAEALRAAIEQKLRVKARDLPRALAQAGRRLPRRLHAEAQVVVEAQRLGGHPKLMRMVDADALDRAYSAVAAYLDKIDPRDMRRGLILSVAGDIAAKLLFVIAAFIVWLWWFGAL